LAEKVKEQLPSLMRAEVPTSSHLLSSSSSSSSVSLDSTSRKAIKQKSINKIKKEFEASTWERKGLAVKKLRRAKATILEKKEKEK
jgi:hypothetical protein